MNWLELKLRAEEKLMAYRQEATMQPRGAGVWRRRAAGTLRGLAAWLESHPAPAAR